MFPDTKRVTYKSPLEEVVPAKRTSSEFGDDSENEIPADDSGGEEETGNASDDHASVPTLQTKNDDERKIPATFAGRHRKRQRQWVWTLGELESTDLVEPDRRDPS